MLASVQDIPTPWITSPLGVLAVLAGTASLFFWIEDRTKWKFFSYAPPLMFIYALPLIMSNVPIGERTLLTNKGPVYEVMSEGVLPFLLVVMLLKVDVFSAVRVMGRGILVMLCGTAGIVLGAPIAYAIVKSKLDPTAWKAFGTLAGSWIGGAGNMNAISKGIDASGTDFGLAVLGDNAGYLVWLPILMSSKGLAKWFNRFAKVDPERIKIVEEASMELNQGQETPAMRHYLYLLFLGLAVTLLARWLSRLMPEFPPVFTTDSWMILWVSTLGLLLSVTPAKRIPGSHEISIALIYLCVANMGARADLSGLKDQAIWFVLGAYIWIALHGAACVLGAWLLHVDIHSTAIASAANIGGTASASIVAGHHNPRLVPVGILMALIGYAIGTYGAFLAAQLCQMIS